MDEINNVTLTTGEINCNCNSIRTGPYYEEMFYELYTFALFIAKERYELDILSTFDEHQSFYLYAIEFYKKHKNDEAFLTKDRSLKILDMVDQIVNDFETGKFDPEHGKPMPRFPKSPIEEVITKLNYWDKRKSLSEIITEG